MLFVGATFASTSCGGGGYATAPSPTPTPTPAPTPAPSGANVTVNIVGSSGSGAFSPNPAAATVGQTLAFKNNDNTQHRIVSNAGSFDIRSCRALPGARRVAAIASPVGVAAELVGDERGLPASSTEEWRAALDQLIADAEERRERGAAARAFAEREYSYERWAPELAGLLRSLA